MPSNVQTLIVPFEQEGGATCAVNGIASSARAKNEIKNVRIGIIENPRFEKTLVFGRAGAMEETRLNSCDRLLSRSGMLVAYCGSVGLGSGRKSLKRLPGTGK